MPSEPPRFTDWWYAHRGEFLLAGMLLGFWAMLLLMAWALREVFTPLILAAVLAYIFNPLITRIEQFGLPRLLAIIGFYVLLLVPGLMLIYFAGPGLLRELVRESNGLAATLQEFKERMRDAVAQYSHLPGWVIEPGDVESGALAPGGAGVSTRPPDVGPLELRPPSPAGGDDLLSNWTGLMQTVLGFLATKGWLGMLTSGTLLTGFYLFFLLLNWNQMLATVGRYVPVGLRGPFRRAGYRADRLLAGFFRGRVPIMITVGLLTAGGLRVCGAGFSVLIGVLAGVSAMVSALPLIVAFVPACISAYISADHTGIPWAWTAATAAVFLGVQTLEIAVLTPLVQGRRGGLHPMVVVPALLVGAKLAGAFGVLVSLPTAALVAVVVGELLLPPLRELARSNGQADDVDDADATSSAEDLLSQPLDEGGSAAEDDLSSSTMPTESSFSAQTHGQTQRPSQEQAARPETVTRSTDVGPTVGRGAE